MLFLAKFTLKRFFAPLRGARILLSLPSPSQTKILATSLYRVKSDTKFLEILILKCSEKINVV
jgi:hypothetical protein